ncbi:MULTISPECIES: fused MFS/spermidine synthase [unclassified Sphingopyxis]|uniref:fused MFS/spermidine synthase n=3 Tax=Sphingopyxis TaxID=165697 RepID=UPI0018D25214|nr:MULTISPECIES: fused MFS/spermidine synthase [unclassified Sphingopyxis]
MRADGRMIGRTSAATMTDRSAEDFKVEFACELETGADCRSIDQAESELDRFLDHLDDIDREQRYFERYGTEHYHASPMEPVELAAPLVFELGNIRSLLANWAFVQSAMSIEDPDMLILDYTRRMMGFLLFHPSPVTIEIIGLGGGSLAKYCHRYLPDTSIVAVEIDPDVIAVREQFFMPPESERFEIVWDDGAEFVRRDTRSCDVLLVDGFDKDGQPAQLCSSSFYRDCHSRLKPGGILVVNLCDDYWKHGSILARIREHFECTIDLPMKIGMNRIIFAFRDGRLPSDPAALLQTAGDLDHIHPISFLLLANEISNSIKSRDERLGDSFDSDFQEAQSLSIASLWSAG